MTALLLSAQILLAVDPHPTNQVVSSYRFYVGLSPNSYFTFYSFPETNQFTISVTNNKVFVACSALNAAGESDLSNEIQVMIFSGHAQLAVSADGPWTNAVQLFVPVQVTEPARFVRVRLETQ